MSYPSQRDSKLYKFYSPKNILMLQAKIQNNVFRQTGKMVRVEKEKLKQFMITQVETSEASTVDKWNQGVVYKASRNIITNMRLRNSRIKYQSRGQIPRPFFRSMNDSVRGTHLINTLNYIGRPSNNRTERNYFFNIQ